ncbi:MAG: hypothetical protein HKN43_13895 [Rhodothermales bacterium]|nr:hypothetical protein [Rhodothermales bacterium]
MIAETDIQNTGVEGRLRSIVDELIATGDLFIVDIVLRGHPGSHSIDVFADSESGASVDQLARLSRAVNNDARMEELLPGGFHLTVSTPGLDRAVSDRRQFVRHVGRKFKVQWKDADKSVTTKGILQSVDPDHISLESGSHEVVQIPFDKIVKAKIDLPW